MVRLSLAGAITLIFFATPGFAQHDGGGSHGDGRDGGGDIGDRGSSDDGRGSSGNDRGEIFGDQGTFGDLHDRIDRTEGLSAADKERLHRTVDRAEGLGAADKERLRRTRDTVKSATDKIREANALVDKLQAQGVIANDPAEKARIEAEVKNSSIGSSKDAVRSTKSGETSRRKSIRRKT